MNWDQPELPFPASDLRAELVATLEHLRKLVDQVPSKLDDPCGCLGTLKIDIGETARTALIAKEVVGAARDIDDALKAALADAMPSKTMVIDGGITLERKGGVIRKQWDHDLLASAVVRLAVVDPDSGEVLMPYGPAQKIADELLACGHVDYWRAGELRARGLDPGQYCTEERGRSTVIIRGPA